MNKVHYLCVLLVLVLLVVLSGCAMKPTSDYSADRKISRTECVTQGDSVVGGFAALDYRCEWPTADSGKTCSGNSDCQGVCEVPGGALVETSAKAECQAACASPAPKQRADGFPVDLCKAECIGVLGYTAPVGTRMSGTCSAKRYDVKTTNCMTLYIDHGTVTKASCVEE